MRHWKKSMTWMHDYSTIERKMHAWKWKSQNNQRVAGKIQYVIQKSDRGCAGRVMGLVVAWGRDARCMLGGWLGALLM